MESKVRKHIVCWSCKVEAARKSWRQIGRKVRVRLGRTHVWAIIKCPDCGSTQTDDEWFDEEES